jgi:hypothetical protein
MQKHRAIALRFRMLLLGRPNCTSGLHRNFRASNSNARPEPHRRSNSAISLAKLIDDYGSARVVARVVKCP